MLKRAVWQSSCLSMCLLGGCRAPTLERADTPPEQPTAATARQDEQTTQAMGVAYVAARATEAASEGGAE
jgi:hypothetical protein